VSVRPTVAILIALALSITPASAQGMDSVSLDDFAVEAGVPLLAPLGAVTELSTFAAGFGLGLTYDPGIIRTPWGSSVNAVVSIERLSHRTTIEGTTLKDTEISVGAETDYAIGPVPLAIVARLCVGLDLHSATGTWNARVTGDTRDTDTFMQLSTGASWSFGPFGSALLFARYSIFPEDGNTGHLLGAVIGYRYQL